MAASVTSVSAYVFRIFLVENALCYKWEMDGVMGMHINHRLH